MKKVKFYEDAIEIKQYEFRISTVRENPIIQLDIIQEVNLNSFPPSIVINHNEVIFIENKYRKEFLKYVKEKKLKVENRFDIWGAINEGFLDSVFTESHKRRTLQQLEENGFSPNEISEIRERIKPLMTGSASISWEADYLGHYDLLLNKKQAYLLHFPIEFYWWSMEIALRNYKKPEDL